MKLDPKIRMAADQTFMELLAMVRVQVLDAKPPAFAASSAIAKMFFTESQKSVLQDLAQLTASWNDSEINTLVAERAIKTLEGMELLEARDYLAKLREIGIVQ
jgi:hypothetical protein